MGELICLAAQGKKSDKYTVYRTASKNTVKYISHALSLWDQEDKWNTTGPPITIRCTSITRRNKVAG